VAHFVDTTVIILFLVQPSLLALALDAWLGQRRPTRLATVVAWMALAVLACMLVGSPLGWIVDRVASGRLALDLLVALSVGIMTFAFLTGVWMARVGGGLLSMLRR
jgi:hypothetical protein